VNLCCFDDSPVRFAVVSTVTPIRRHLFLRYPLADYRPSIRYKRIVMPEFQSFSEGFGCSSLVSTLSANRCICTNLHDLFKTSV
jgi:hypothetical protein